MVLLLNLISGAPGHIAHITSQMHLLNCYGEVWWGPEKHLWKHNWPPTRHDVVVHFHFNGISEPADTESCYFTERTVRVLAWYLSQAGVTVMCVWVCTRVSVCVCVLKWIIAQIIALSVGNHSLHAQTKMAPPITFTCFSLNVPNPFFSNAITICYDFWGYFFFIFKLIIK